VNTTVDTACGREVKMRAKDVRQFDFWPVILCCDECVTVVKSQNSWVEEVFS
jgi:hypothetical protein